MVDHDNQMQDKIASGATEVEIIDLTCFDDSVLDSATIDQQSSHDDFMIKVTEARNRNRSRVESSKLRQFTFERESPPIWNVDDIEPLEISTPAPLIYPGNEGIDGIDLNGVTDLTGFTDFASLIANRQEENKLNASVEETQDQQRRRDKASSLYLNKCKVAQNTVVLHNEHPYAQEQESFLAKVREAHNRKRIRVRSSKLRQITLEQENPLIKKADIASLETSKPAHRSYAENQQASATDITGFTDTMDLTYSCSNDREEENKKYGSLDENYNHQQRDCSSSEPIHAETAQSIVDARSEIVKAQEDTSSALNLTEATQNVNNPDGLSFQSSGSTREEGALAGTIASKTPVAKHEEDMLPKRGSIGSMALPQVEESLLELVHEMKVSQEKNVNDASFRDDIDATEHDSMRSQQNCKEQPEAKEETVVAPDDKGDSNNSSPFCCVNELGSDMNCFFEQCVERSNNTQKGTSLRGEIGGDTHSRESSFARDRNSCSELLEESEGNPDSTVETVESFSLSSELSEEGGNDEQKCRRQARKKRCGRRRKNEGKPIEMESSILQLAQDFLPHSRQKSSSLGNNRSNTIKNKYQQQLQVGQSIRTVAAFRRRRANAPLRKREQSNQDAQRSGLCVVAPTPDAHSMS